MLKSQPLITFDDAPEEARGAGDDAPKSLEMPEVPQARLHRACDHEVVRVCGVRYRRCGGGRQIIRRGGGNY